MKQKIRSLLVAFGLLFQFAGAQISTFPHHTDFEQEGLCGTVCTVSCNLLGGWKNADQYGFAQAGTDWLSEDGPTPSGSTGPDIDHTLGTASGKYAYVEASSCANASAYLVSPIYDFSGFQTPRLRIWYHMYGSAMGSMQVDVDTSGLGNWILAVGGSWSGNLNQWQERVVDLSDFGNKSNVRLRINGLTGSNFNSDMGVDDLEVFIPDGFDLVALAVNSGSGCGQSTHTPITITYTQAGSDTIPSGDTLFFGSAANGNTYSDTLVVGTNILPGDTIVHTLQNGVADLSGPVAVAISAWVGYMQDIDVANDTAFASILGVPIVSNLPFFEDFESGPNGWVISNNVNGTWAWGAPSKTIINAAASGVNCFVNGGLTGQYLDLDNSWVSGPCLDFSDHCDPVLEMKVWWNAEFSWDGMNVTTSIDGGNTWQLVGDYQDPFNWYTDNSVNGAPGTYQSAWSGRNLTTNGSGTWVTAKHRLTGLGGMQNARIRINFGSDGSVTDEGVAFDDVRIYNGFVLQPDVTLCAGDTLDVDLYTGNNSATYAWNTGDTVAALSIQQAGNYAVAMSANPLCTILDTFFVAVFDSLSVIDLGADTLVCGSLLQIDAGYWPDANYAWSNGDSTQIAAVGVSGQVDVVVQTGCGTLQDTLQLAFLPLPFVSLGPDTAGCDSITLIALSNAMDFLWSTGSFASSILVSSSGNYSVVVTDSNGCSRPDTIQVVIGTGPQVELGNDTILCGGAFLGLGPSTVAASYLWSTGATTSSISVNSAGTYWLVAADAIGCTGNDSIAVTTGVQASASPTAANIGGSSFQFSSNGVGNPTTYLWDFGDGQSSNSTDPSHTYSTGSGTYTVTLIVSNACGSDTSTTIAMAVSVENPISGSFLLVPNPAADEVMIQSMPGSCRPESVRLYDHTGRVLREAESANSGVDLRFDLEGVAAGYYVLEIQCPDATQRLRLIVSN